MRIARADVPSAQDNTGVLFDPGTPKPQPVQEAEPEPEPVVPVDNTMPLPFESLAGAVFNDDRTLRYVLWRRLKHKGPSILFVCLNPSTADETIDDPTVRRCIDFAKRWGYARIFVCNLLPLRSTDPKPLLTYMWPDHAIRDNLKHIDDVAGRCSKVVVAWGNWGKRFVDEELWALDRIRKHVGVECFRVTKQGRPWHPLYLAKKTETIPYSLKEKPSVVENDL